MIPYNERISGATYTQREILAALQNAHKTTERPSGKIPPNEIHRARLRNYAAAVIEGLFPHVEDGLLTVEQLIHVLISCAFMLHLSKVMKKDDIPKAIWPGDDGPAGFVKCPCCDGLGSLTKEKYDEIVAPKKKRKTPRTAPKNKVNSKKRVKA